MHNIFEQNRYLRWYISKQTSRSKWNYQFETRKTSRISICIPEFLLHVGFLWLAFTEHFAGLWDLKLLPHLGSLRFYTRLWHFKYNVYSRLHVNDSHLATANLCTSGVHIASYILSGGGVIISRFWYGWRIRIVLILSIGLFRLIWFVNLINGCISIIRLYSINTISQFCHFFLIRLIFHAQKKTPHKPLF